MPKVVFLIVTLLYFALPVFGQETENWLIQRLGTRNAATMHYNQFYQQRGRWIGLDVIHIDYGKNNYQELFFGGGRVLVKDKPLGSAKVSLTHEEYLGAAVGSASKSAKYVLDWTKVDYKFSTKIGGNAVYYAYLPLNAGAYFHQGIERAKVEYDFGRFKLGAGYAWSKAGGKPGQNKPMFVPTLKLGKFGSLEFWAQRIPGNHFLAQVRYAGFFKTGKHDN
jgi:hypothetical protein